MREALVSHLRRRKVPLTLSGMLIIAASLLALASPLLFRYLCDQILVPRSGEALVPFVLVTAVVWACQRCAAIIGESWFFRIHQEILMRLQTDIVDHLLRLPSAFFETQTSGYLQSRVDEDLRGAGFLFSAGMLALLGNVVQVAVGLVILVWFAPWLALLLILVGIPMGLVTAAAGRLMWRLSGKAREASARARGHLQESLANQVLLKTGGAEARRRDEWAGKSRRAIAAVWEQMLALGVAQLATGILPALLMGAAMIGGALGVIQGTWSLGTFLAVLLILRQVAGPLELLAFSHLQIQESLSAWNRLAILAGLAVETSPPDARPCPKLAGRVTFDQVNFAFPGRHPLLRDVCFQVQAGQRVLILGPSGAGKSTLVHLLLRFYKPTSGTIRFDENPASELDLAQLRSRLGFVSQSPRFLSGSITENLHLVCPGGEGARIRSLAAEFEIDAPIQALPKGYETELGESGCGLSVGQLQRLALVRALLADPDVLILDEPTSAIDEETAAVIRRRLPVLAAGKTIFFVVHDRRFVDPLDLVLFLAADGHLSSGVHQDLLTTDAGYRGFFTAV